MLSHEGNGKIWDLGQLACMPSPSHLHLSPRYCHGPWCGLLVSPSHSVQPIFHTAAETTYGFSSPLDQGPSPLPWPSMIWTSQLSSLILYHLPPAHHFTVLVLFWFVEHIKCFYLGPSPLFFFCLEWSHDPVFAFPDPSHHFHFLSSVTSSREPFSDHPIWLVVLANYFL